MSPTALRLPLLQPIDEIRTSLISLGSMRIENIRLSHLQRLGKELRYARTPTRFPPRHRSIKFTCSEQYRCATIFFFNSMNEASYPRNNIFRTVRTPRLPKRPYRAHVSSHVILYIQSHHACIASATRQMGRAGQSTLSIFGLPAPDMVSSATKRRKPGLHGVRLAPNVKRPFCSPACTCLLEMDSRTYRYAFLYMNWCLAHAFLRSAAPQNWRQVLAFQNASLLALALREAAHNGYFSVPCFATISRNSSIGC